MKEIRKFEKRGGKGKEKIYFLKFDQILYNFRRQHQFLVRSRTFQHFLIYVKEEQRK